MMKKIFAISAIIAISACGLGGQLGGTVSPVLQAENQKLTVSYQTAITSVLEGQKDLAAALDLKDQVTELENQANAAKSGNLTVSDIDKTVELSTSTNKLISDKLAQGQELSSESKTLVAKGLGNYAVGTVATAALVKSGADFVNTTKNTLSTASIPDKLATVDNIKVGTAIATKVPGLAKDLLSTGKQLIDLAKKSGVNTAAAQKTMSKAAGF